LSARRGVAVIRNIAEAPKEEAEHAHGGGGMGGTGR
jgi:hypothetical protein